MQIGTAAPTPEELAVAPHHFIHNISIQENYSVGSFEKQALQTIAQLHSKNQVVILVGGSGLYVNAVNKGLDHFPTVDPKIRTKLNTQLEQEGIAVLQNQLKTLDTVSYNTIAINNPHRLIRALEICIGTGKPYASFLNKNKAERPFKAITIGLTANRQDIYNRINARVDIMLEQGLLNEAKSLFMHKDLNALNTVGYKELFNYFNGQWTLEFAVSEIKKNSRRFAKRQLTWFKRNENTLWFDYSTPFDIIIKAIEPLL